MQEAHQY
jgi:hypothetical protein